MFPNYNFYYNLIFEDERKGTFKKNWIFDDRKKCNVAKVSSFNVVFPFYFLFRCITLSAHVVDLTSF